MTPTFQNLRAFHPRASLLPQKYLRQGTLSKLSSLSRQKRIRLRILGQCRVYLTVLRVDPCLQILTTTGRLCDLQWVGGVLIWKLVGGAGKTGKSPVEAGRTTFRILNSRIVIAIFPTDVPIVRRRVLRRAPLTGTMAGLAGQKLARGRGLGLLRVLHPAPDPRRESGLTDCHPTVLVEVHSHPYTPVVMGHQTSATCVTVSINRPTFGMTPPVIGGTASAPSIGGTR
jgi:hypothetical protein